MNRCTSRTRRSGAALATTAALAALACLAPATSYASTNVSVTLVAGTLSISEPASVNLGSATSNVNGTTVTGHLGTTTVSDTRASLAGWTVTIASSNFSDGAGHSVAASKLKAYVATGDGPSVSGLAVPTTTYTTSATALTLSTTAQNFMTATTTGSNSVTYDPTIVVTLDGSVLAGTYSGTITQSVS